MSGFLVAAAHKSSGKTVISGGLVAALRVRGRSVQAFKKGPDYIDPMWLAAASGKACYNLDFNTMGREELRALYFRRSIGADIALVEANKGLFDGVDIRGADSNAQLAKILETPVVLVIDVTGMTRGIAPLLTGYRAFDPKVNIAGVILNKVGGPRHESKLIAAVDEYSDLPVIGSVWRHAALNIDERHLGLTTPGESGEIRELIADLAEIVGNSVDMDWIISTAGTAPSYDIPCSVAAPPPATRVRIGIARDSAFGFYYPDDLEAFGEAGADLVAINMLEDAKLPKLDGLFIGGGFPETQMQQLSANRTLRDDIKNAIEYGLPTYAECGGLIYLCRSLEWDGERHEMAGAVPADAVMCPRPQGRGYTEFVPMGVHPWGEDGHLTVAHEFHYARIENLPPDVQYTRKMTRGSGIDGTRDGIVIQNLIAGFCHLRNTQSYPWVRRFVEFVRSRKAVSD
jgi:cobyrinic acid a,c-diamide synthase